MVQKIIVNNILSFGTETTFSLVPERGLRSHSNHITKVGHNRSLRGAIMYGSNAAGKSNLLKSVEILSAMFKANTCKVSAGLQFAMNRKPAMAWIIEYSFKDYCYKYVLTTDGSVVIYEKLFSFNNKGDEKLLFSRFNKRSSVKFGSILGNEAWYSQRTLSQDALLLRKFELDALDAQPDNMQGKKILQYAIWGLHSIRVIHSSSLISPDAFGRLLNMSNFRDFLKDLMRQSDVGITDMSWQKVSPTKLKYVNIGSIRLSDGLQILPLKESFMALQVLNGKIISAFEFKFSHEGYWMRADQESEGTLRLMHLSAFIYILNMSESTWFVDELDCHLHPHISKWLLDKALSNKVKSQLVVTAHDTNLMTRDLWRTDEVWLVEKRMDGSTNMNTLRQLRGPLSRKLADGYINGLYGAIPHVGGNMI